MAHQSTYVSRAGLKLEHALHEFDVDPTGLRCADLGCNVGGFTDCLLKHGAKSVLAVDTGYGLLDWKLRQDDRVEVMERTNALHLAEKIGDRAFDLIVIDLGWTPQRLAIPAALPHLEPTDRVITLIKPHYEATDEEKTAHMTDGALTDSGAEIVFRRVRDALPCFGLRVLGSTQSPLRGGKSSKGRKGAGNIEFLVLGEAADR